jgi:hypothetical protein
MVAVRCAMDEVYPLQFSQTLGTACRSSTSARLNSWVRELLALKSSSTARYD